MSLPQRSRRRRRRASPHLPSVGAFLAAATLLLGFSAPAEAQPLAVSNQGQTTSGRTAFMQQDCAQGFTTGPHLEYALNAITLDMQRAPSSGITVTVTVRGDNGSGDPSNTVSYTLTNPSLGMAGIRRFNAPFGARLNANSQYFVHVAYSGNGTIPRWNLTTSNAEDSGAATGWSIANQRHTRPSGGTGSWTSSSFLQLVYKMAMPMHDADPIQSGTGTWPDEQSARRWSCRNRIARC